MERKDSARRLPLFSSLGGYDRAWLRGDLVAGLTVWAVLVPEALAYASIAGVSPVVGLYAAPGALLLYAAFGSSRHLVTGPMSATAALSAAAVAEVATKGSASFAAHTTALAITTGLLALAAGLLRLGFLASFISEPVLKGFIIGLALTIIAGQLPDLLGIPAGDGDVFAQAGHLATHLGDANPWTAAVGLGSLALLLGLKRVAPAAPAALGVVVAGIAAVALFDLAGRGVEVIGQVEGAVPLPAIPSVGWDELVGLLPGAAAAAIIGYAESATVAESMANEHGYTVEPDRELRAVGAANVLSGLFQGFITGGGASQSAANDRAGANTQLVSLVVSGLTVVTAVALLPLFRDLPQAALGAVVISAVLGFLNLAALDRVRRLRRYSFVIALVSLVAVLILGVLQGLILGVVISVGAFLVSSSRPGSSVRAEPGLLVYRLNAPLLFVNAKRLRDGIRAGVRDASPPVRVVLLDLSFTPELDIESVNVLGSLRHELAGQGIALWLAGVHAQVAGMLDRSGLAGEIGRDRLYRDVEDAVADASA